MSLSSGVQWCKSSYNFALEYLDYTTNIIFPLRTIPVRHLGSVDDGEERICFCDTFPTHYNHKGMLCIDVIRPASLVNAASRCVSIGRVWVWYTCIDIWKNMYVRKGIIIVWKVYSDPITIIIINCLHHHYVHGAFFNKRMNVHNYNNLMHSLYHLQAIVFPLKIKVI